MKVSKPYILIATIIVIAGVIDFINANSVSKKGSDEAISVVPRMSSEQSGTKKEEKSKRYELAKEITTPDGYINTDGKAIAINSLIGKKVILIDFWTYSCINCQRTTPYLNAWYEKYKDKGFVIIGIHTPEFGFEKDYNNVKAAVEKFGIKFPVVLDNDYSTWTAYKNQYWPRKYLIDIDGYVVYDHIGEGQYEETEQKIQEALGERMAILGEDGTIDKAITKEIPVQGGPKSPETYFGATSNQFFGNGTRGVVGDQKSLIAPAKINPDTLYLSGDCNIANESAQNGSPNAGIEYKYNAKDVFFVSQADNEIVVEVLRDGEPLGSEAGADIVKNSDGKTFVKIKEARLYKIIQGDRSEAHIIEFRILKPGLEAFTFTFG